MKLSSVCFSNVYNNFSPLLRLRLSTRRYRKLRNQQKKEVSFLVIGRYSKNSYYDKLFASDFCEKRAFFFATPTKRKIILRRFVVDTEPEFVCASRILCCKVFGPKVQTTKEWLARGLLNCGPTIAYLQRSVRLLHWVSRPILLLASISNLFLQLCWRGLQGQLALFRSLNQKLQGSNSQNSAKPFRESCTTLMAYLRPIAL